MLRFACRRQADCARRGQTPRDNRVVNLFKKIESLRSQLKSPGRSRSQSGAFAKWEDVSDIWNDGEVATEDGTKLEIAAMEEDPEASPSEDGAPNLFLSPCLTRKRKAETKTPQKSQVARGKSAADLSPCCGSDVKDKGFEAMMQKESRMSFSSGRSQKRKTLDSLQCEIKDMEKKLDNKTCRDLGLIVIPESPEPEEKKGECNLWGKKVEKNIDQEGASIRAKRKDKRGRIKGKGGKKAKDKETKAKKAKDKETKAKKAKDKETKPKNKKETKSSKATKGKAEGNDGTKRSRSKPLGSSSASTPSGSTPPDPMPASDDPQSARKVGCSRCRYIKAGCVTCRNPNFRPRGPRKAAAKSMKPTKK
eukprot:s1545_g7.t3